jgi:hypothetical protein
MHLPACLAVSLATSCTATPPWAPCARACRFRSKDSTGTNARARTWTICRDPTRTRSSPCSPAARRLGGVRFPCRAWQVRLRPIRLRPPAKQAGAGTGARRTLRRRSRCHSGRWPCRRKPRLPCPARRPWRPNRDPRDSPSTECRNLRLASHRKPRGHRRPPVRRRHRRSPARTSTRWRHGPRRQPLPRGRRRRSRLRCAAVMPKTCCSRCRPGARPHRNR